MKKAIVLLLLVCFCVLCLSACSPSKDPKDYFTDEEIAGLDKVEYTAKGTVIAYGGGFDQNDDQRMIIVRKSIEICGKEQPKMLFMTSGHGDKIDGNENFIRHYTDAGCIVKTLQPSLESKEAMIEKIGEADIIYETGGNLNGLTQIWGKAGVFAEMRKAYERGAVLVGVSTGAMCWAEMGYDNSSEEETIRVITDFPFIGKEAEYDYYYATGILPFCICPHFDNIAYRHFGRKAKKLDVPSLAIENGAAVIYHAGKYEVMVDPTTPKRKCYLYFPEKGIKKVDVTEDASLVGYVDAYRRLNGYKAHDE